jgi:hypothetical protein
MKPKKFRECNVIFCENPEEYAPFPVFINDSPRGEVVSCWHLSFIERLRLLIKGKIWLSVLTFNRNLLPMFLTTKKSDVITIKIKK